MKKNKSSGTRDYSEYVVHPRYGQSPRYTGLNPAYDPPSVIHHYNTRRLDTESWLVDYSQPDWESHLESVFVPFTAIEADVSRQSPRSIQFTHYFDIDCICSDCGKRFLFFAEEQKYWYEELALPLEADATRCVFCRKVRQGIAKRSRHYEKLYHVPNKSPEEMLEMAECCVELMQAAVFTPSKCRDIRAMMKRLPEETKTDERFVKIMEAVRKIEAGVKSEH